MSKDATKDAEMRARIGGIAAQMEKFDFLFFWGGGGGVELGRKILNIADNLSRSLQSTLISACDGQRIVRSTLKALQSIRTEECFDLFWSYLEKKQCAISVPSPSILCRRKVPKHNEVGKSAPEHPPTARDHYRRRIDLSRKATRFSVNCRQF